MIQSDPHDGPQNDASDIHEEETPITLLEQRNEELEQAVGIAKEDSIRLLAELENQRKRFARDLDSARKYGAEKLLAELLPVCDSLEAGLSTGMMDAAKLREGMELTLKLLNKATDAHGLAAVSPQGQPFNPDQHQAMSMVDGGQHAPGTVMQVYQKGYVLNERLLRPALVAVAKEQD